MAGKFWPLLLVDPQVTYTYAGYYKHEISDWRH